MHLYFDFFGTLCDTATTSIDATRAILRRNGFDSTDADAFKRTWDAANDHLCHGDFMIERELFRQGFLTACELFELKPKSDSVDELVDATENRALYPDALDCVQRLAQEHTIHIGSNTDNHAIDAILGPLRDHCASVSTSEDLRAYKPRPEFYERMLAAGDSRPEESLYVGDNALNDVIAPTRLGIRSYFIERTSPSPGFARAFSSLTEFADALLAER